MKKTVIVSFLAMFLIAGCARTWMFQPIESYKPAGAAPPAASCEPCHKAQFDAWKATRHGDPQYMTKIPVQELRECGACHDNLAAHAADAGQRPAAITKMTRTDRNMLCGKCHYNQQIFGSDAINPHDRHALIADVALEGQKKQIACLDCHSGHKGGSEMLVRIKAHICFECHTSAIITMGVFQPLNYLTFGKMCQACHTVHGGSSGERWGRMGVGFCVVCHFVGVALVD